MGEVFLLQQRWLDLGLWSHDSYVKKDVKRGWNPSLCPPWVSTPHPWMARGNAGRARQRREELSERVSNPSLAFTFASFRSQTPAGQGTNTHTTPGKPVAEQGSQSWGLCSLCLLPDLHMSGLQGRDLKPLKHRLFLALGPGRVAEQSGDWQNT